MSDFQPVLSARLGKKNSCALATYVADGGYTSWKKVLAGSKTGEWTPAMVTDLVKASGLRGRGGAGFPTGMKWTFVPPKEKRGDKPVYLLCNADESEPGTFKDRILIEKDPHQILEGMMLASFALDVKHAYIYIRGEMVHGAEILNAAIDEAYAAGLLGKNVLGSGLDLDLTVHRGGGAYICGEETALIESLEGKRGHPRIKPPFPAVSGVWNAPTVVNNVETLCCVKHILDRGADWFKGIGRNERNTGPKLYCVSGHVEKPGVYEAPMGIPFRDLLAMCGGMKGGRKVKAVIPGGSSAPMLTGDEMMDVPLDFDGVAAAKSMLGSAAIIVMDETTDIPRAVTNIAKFYAHESCGQCTPCREGTPWLHKMLKRIVNGQGKKADVEMLLQVAGQMGNGMTICVFADAAIAPILSAIPKFREEFEAYVDEVRAPGLRAASRGRDHLEGGRADGGRDALLMAKVTVDGRTVEVPGTANVLEACRAAGVDVPHFCYHPRLSIVGQCRMCMVEIEGVPKIQASCTVPVRDGMVVLASSEKALAARNATMEFLLINHPLDCPICDQAGECKLQDNAVAAGLPVSRTVEPRRQFPGYDRTSIGPHVIADMTRCIQCTRCIRFCNEISGTGELSLIERGGHAFVWTHEGKALDNEWSACAADVCPVGALTTKEFRFRKRVWWLDKASSVCDGCEIGCNVSIEHRDRTVYRFLPRVNLAVNDFWMCDYGRFRAEELNGNDFTRPVLRAGGKTRETHWGEALDAVKAAVDAAVAKDPASVLVLGSARLATEESWLLAQLFKGTVGATRRVPPRPRTRAEDQEPRRSRRLARRQGSRAELARRRGRGRRPRREGLGPRPPPRRVVHAGRPLRRRRGVHVPRLRPGVRPGTLPGEDARRPRAADEPPHRRGRHPPPRGEPRRQGRDVRERPRPRPAVPARHRPAADRQDRPRGPPPPRKEVGRLRHPVDGEGRLRADEGHRAGIRRPRVGFPGARRERRVGLAHLGLRRPPRAAPRESRRDPRGGRRCRRHGGEK